MQSKEYGWKPSTYPCARQFSTLLSDASGWFTPNHPLVDRNKS
jgi:hypothetical protein